jgi:DNA-binding MarR family transcriptional regulator
LAVSQNGSQICKGTRQNQYCGILLPGFMILKKIIQDGEQRLTNLAEEFDFTSGAITALCDKLEERASAARKFHKEDRRIVWLDITDDGRDFINRNSNIGVATISDSVC